MSSAPLANRTSTTPAIVQHVVAPSSSSSSANGKYYHHQQSVINAPIGAPAPAFYPTKINPTTAGGGNVPPLVHPSSCYSLALRQQQQQQQQAKKQQQQLHQNTANNMMQKPLTTNTSTTNTSNVRSNKNNNNNKVNNNITNTNSKRPLMTTTKDGRQLSEKKLRRLEKNRLSARECRRRKREATENMQHEINILEGENLQLRLKLKVGEEAEENLGKEQSKVTEEINKLLQCGASESEIYGTIERFKEKFADYGRDRRSAIEFHLGNIERLLMPTQTTTICMKALEGGLSTNSSSSVDDELAPPPPAVSATSSSCNSSSCSNESSETKDSLAAIIAPLQDITTTPPSSASGAAMIGSSTATTTTSTTKGGSKSSSSSLETKKLFEYLVKYLEVTPEQAAALKDSRWVAQDLDDSLATSLTVLQELRTRLNQAGNGMEAEFDKVRDVLTPTQAAKFLVWVANNRACIHMLNELWNRVYGDINNPNNNTVNNNNNNDNTNNNENKQNKKRRNSNSNSNNNSNSNSNNNNNNPNATATNKGDAKNGSSYS